MSNEHLHSALSEFADLTMTRVEQNNLWRGFCIDWYSRTLHIIFVTAQIVNTRDSLSSQTLPELISALQNSRATGVYINMYREYGLSTCIQVRISQRPFFPITKTYRSIIVTPPIKDDIENLKVSV